MRGRIEGGANESRGLKYFGPRTHMLLLLAGAS